MNRPPRADLRSLYDAIYERFDSTDLFHSVLQSAMGRGVPASQSQLSFLKRSDLEHIASEIHCLGCDASGLDLGCGLGDLTFYLADRFKGFWTGFDISHVAVGAAQRRKNSRAAAFLVGNMDDMPFRAGAFNCVVAIDSIQHSGSYERSASQLRRVLAPGGIFLFTNWMMRRPLDQLTTMDPLLSALAKYGFSISSTFETDPRLELQVRVYAALYQRRNEARLAIGDCLLDIMFAEAGHLIPLRDAIGRYLTVARAR
jgi:SAM-dependent methyltransferase